MAKFIFIKNPGPPGPYVPPSPPPGNNFTNSHGTSSFYSATANAGGTSNAAHAIIASVTGVGGSPSLPLSVNMNFYRQVINPSTLVASGGYTVFLGTMAGTAPYGGSCPLFQNLFTADRSVNGSVQVTGYVSDSSGNQEGPPAFVFTQVYPLF